MYLGENYYAQYQNDIYLNKFTNKLLNKTHPLMKYNLICY